MDNGDAVLPWSKVTADAIQVFASFVVLVLADKEVEKQRPASTERCATFYLHILTGAAAFLL